jgi:hypothetical protein
VKTLRSLLDEPVMDLSPCDVTLALRGFSRRSGLAVFDRRGPHRDLQLEVNQYSNWTSAR